MQLTLGTFKNQTLQHHFPYCKQYMMQHVLSFPETIEDVVSLYDELTSLMEDQTYEHISTYHDFSCR